MYYTIAASPPCQVRKLNCGLTPDSGFRRVHGCAARMVHAGGIDTPWLVSLDSPKPAIHGRFLSCANQMKRARANVDAATLVTVRPSMSTFCQKVSSTSTQPLTTSSLFQVEACFIFHLTCSDSIQDRRSGQGHLWGTSRYDWAHFCS